MKKPKPDRDAAAATGSEPDAPASGDAAWDLCRRLAGETLERIRELRRQASVRVAQLLEVIEQRLLDPDLDVNDLLRECGLRDPNVLTLFAAEVGFTPKAYILDNRMELAARMLVGSTLRVWRIGVQVGYLHPGSFGRAFKKWSGKTPGQFRQAAGSAAAAEPPMAPEELISRREIRRAMAGELAPERAEALAGRLYGLGDMVCAGYRQLSPPAGGARTVESTMARNLWQWIEPLPYEVQMRAVESQGSHYRTLVLFNRLCTLSVEAEGGVRALQLATLALASLHAMGERVGEHYLSVFARAYAILGYARLRAGEGEGAAEDFGQAQALVAMAGDDAHPVVVAELCLYQATLEIERDNFSEADRLTRVGSEILRRVVELALDSPGEAAGVARAIVASI